HTGGRYVGGQRVGRWLRGQHGLFRLQNDYGLFTRGAQARAAVSGVTGWNVAVRCQLESCSTPYRLRLRPPTPPSKRSSTMV
ncbi:MAG TPA: hypothetical protein VIM14_06645, partial [Polyangia bacterium]